MILGLRIDVDTFRGTRDGIPRLRKILGRYEIRATFYLTVGPDNMGRHLFRLFKPEFIVKMVRSSAPRLYGWDIVFKGVLWPGPLIGKKLGKTIATLKDGGHEIGLHAWDHHAWQTRIEKMNKTGVRKHLKKASDTLFEITGEKAVTSAVPGWRSTDTSLEVKEEFGFLYNSDCRGDSVFFPLVSGKKLSVPQVPVTLPTYDEVVGRNGISRDSFNPFIFSLLRPNRLNVLTIHAEAEGGCYAGMFSELLDKALHMGITVIPLGKIIQHFPPNECSSIIKRPFPGREGWLSVQKER
ncbi:MAG: 4-deoxy-4-formamido-L-arabinose-phosphoundecaprenol deformylase [Deltaproteobacteria bacterium]|nr:4-deoxy-4-formamido-L-arabinose-phosphoundecaprenol deformylase [Deltaproteobacteria bacterium]